MKKPSFRQAQQVLKLVGQADLTTKELQMLLVSGIFTDVLMAAGLTTFSHINRNAVRVTLGLPGLPFIKIESLGEVVVPPNATTAAMIERGDYDSIDPRITPAHFPITTYGQRCLHWACCFSRVTSQQVVHELATRPDLALARIEDLLAFGAHPEYRELLQGVPIVCLGSPFTVEDETLVPYFYALEEEHDLCLAPGKNKWHPYTRFLLVEK